MHFLFAWRYFRGKYSFQAIQLIAWVSVFAIAIGTAALITILSVSNGFSEIVNGLYSDFYADLRVVPSTTKFVKLTQAQLSSVRQIPGVHYATGILENKAILVRDENQTVVFVKGVDSKEKVMEVVQQRFRPEFLNRLDDIILFDAEDYGQPENSNYPLMQDSWCLGSQYWSKNPHKQNYFARYGILLDMVGAKDATFRHEQISFYYGSSILQKVWRKANRLGFGEYFVFENAKQIMDDHYYVNTITGIPTIDIIEYDPSTESNFNKHWHTHKDDMDNIDKETLNAVGQTVLDVIYHE